MDVEYLLGSVLRDVLTSRGHRKRVKGAMRYVLGNPRAAGGGALLLGGLAYALYESLTKGSGIGTSPAPVNTWGGTLSSTAPVVPPPLPVIATAPTAAVVPPPLPATTPPATLPAVSATSAPVVPPDVLRVIRLSISAARADGQFTVAEQDAILAHARTLRAEGLIEDDLQRAVPVGEILAGVADDTQRQHLYEIAFAIVRADEHVTEGERVYLRAVAAALTLDDPTVARLEEQASARITTAAREG